VSDEQKKVWTGSKLNVTLRRKGKGTPSASPRPTQAKRGIIPVDDETTRYLRRANPLVTFYDLGTRLRSVESESDASFLLDANPPAPARHDGYKNEYVELRMEAPALLHTQDDGSLSLSFSEQIDAADWSRLLALVLASRADPEHETFDPFGTSPANGSGRALANVMPLSFLGSYNFELALRFTYEDATTQTYALSDLTGHAEEWKPPRAAPSGELWNSLNLSDETAQHEGKLKPKAKELKNLASLKLTSPTLFYEAFDTASSDVKITREPSPSAAAVALPASFKSLRVYLVPRLGVMYRQIGRRRRVLWNGTVGGVSLGGVGTAISVAYQGFFAERLPVHPWARLHARTWGDVFRLTGAEAQAMNAFNKVFDRSNIFTTRTLVETRIGTGLTADDLHIVGFESGVWGAAELDARNASALTDALLSEMTDLVESGQIDDDSIIGFAQGQLFAETMRVIPAGQLVAALGSGNQVFYVWNMEEGRVGQGYRVLSLRV
jgi:hypothetical protein